MDAPRLTQARRIGALVSIAVLLFVLLAACGGGDDDDTTATSGTAPTATSAAPAATNPTNAGTPTSAAQADVTPTSTSADTAEPTATVEEPDATPTAEEADATPTGDSGGEAPLEDFKPIDPEALPNFSLDVAYEFSNLDEAGETTKFVMEVRQSATDNYYLRVDSGADGIYEAWRVGDRSWTGSGGTIIEDPTGSGGFITPSLFLQQVQSVPEDVRAEKVGEEEVSGRRATRYRADPEYLIQAMQEGSESDFLAGASDIEGTAEFWIDNELKIMLRVKVDMTWRNANGTTGVMKQDYEVYDIGETAPIDPPQ